MHTVLFPLNVRLSTWVALGVFLLLARRGRDRTPLLAGAAWLAGFEATFQVVSLAARHPLPSWKWGPFALMALGLVVVSLTVRRGIRPNPALMVLAAAFWLAWIATGFHVNLHGGVAFSSLAEAMNEAAKTAWAAAYVWPLWRRRDVGVAAAASIAVAR